MYYGAIINGTNTLTAYNGVLGADVAVEAPEIRTALVEIPGRNGVIDATGVIGVSKGNRKITFTVYFPFSTTSAQLAAAVAAAESLHGTVATLTLPDDTAHYYQGRLAVTQNRAYGRYAWDVEMDAEPTLYTVTA